MATDWNVIQDKTVPERVRVKELADWWDMSRTHARAITRQPDFPKPDEDGYWELDDVDAWLDKNDRELDPRLHREEDEIQVQLWNVPWNALAWWQKPIQAVGMAVKGTGWGLVMIAMVIGAALLGLLMLVYAYKMMGG